MNTIINFIVLLLTIGCFIAFLVYYYNCYKADKKNYTSFFSYTKYSETNFYMIVAFCISFIIFEIICLI